MRTLLSVLAAGILLANARADEVASTGTTEAIDESVLAVESAVENDEIAPHEPNTLLRLKSGVSFPQDDSEISHLVPVTLDWQYLGFSSLGLGASFSWVSGSSPVQIPGPNRALGSELRKSMALALASADYCIQKYPVRALVGARAGWLFYRDSTTAPSGSIQTDMHSETRFIAGPAVTFDFAIRDAFFASVGGEYLFAENAYKVGSITVGFGAEF